MGYAAYPELKESGISRLGKVPAHWQPKRLRFASQTNPSANGLGLESDTPVSFVPMDAVGEYGGIRTDVDKAIGDIGTGYTFFADGDVIVAKITPCFENCKGALAEGLTNGVAFGTTELHVLRAGKELDARFLFYLTISHPFRALGEAEMYGAGGQKRVPDSFIKDFRPALPPLPEQQAIARFLDHKTAQIDALIAKKQALLQKLAEKRTALISHAVTKGLDPSAPMKDTGIAWLGIIPAHWELKQLRHVGQAIIGLTYAPSDVASDGNGTLVLRSSNIQGGKLCFDDNVHVGSPIPDELRTRIGDILICSRNGSRGLIGKNAVITEDAAAQTFGAFMTIFRSDASEFVHRIFNSTLFSYQSSACLTSTINQLTIGHLNSMLIAWPPEKERNQICEFLRVHLKKLDELPMKVERAISNLKEYRSALITAAVSGKIDVRGVPIPEGA